MTLMTPITPMTLVTLVTVLLASGHSSNAPDLFRTRALGRLENQEVKHA